MMVICALQSDDRASIVIEKGLVLQRGGTGSWDHPLLGNPVVCCFVGDNEERWFMYYTATNELSLPSNLPLSGWTGVVTSTDGFHWVRPKLEMDQDGGLNIIMKENKENWWTFDTIAVSVSDVQIMFSPNVNSGEDGVFWMFYSGCTNEPSSVNDQSLRKYVMRSGVAMSQDGYYWARIEGDDSTGALLDVGDEGDWDHSFIGRPQVLNCGTNDLRMYYHSYDMTAGKYRIGLATSTNGLRWKKQGVLFSGSEKFMFDAKGAASQSVVFDQDNKQFVMFYEAVDAHEERSIGLAISQDGLKNWYTTIHYTKASLHFMLFPRVVYEEPLLEKSSDPECWDCGSVGTPWAVSMAEGRWRVYYSGTSQNAPNWEGIGVCLSNPSSPTFKNISTHFMRKKRI